MYEFLKDQSLRSTITCTLTPGSTTTTTTTFPLSLWSIGLTSSSYFSQAFFSLFTRDETIFVGVQSAHQPLHTFRQFILGNLSVVISIRLHDPIYHLVIASASAVKTASTSTTKSSGTFSFATWSTLWAHFRQGNLAVLVGVQFLERSYGILDFLFGKFAVLIRIQCGKDGRSSEASHAARSTGSAELTARTSLYSFLPASGTFSPPLPSALTTSLSLYINGDCGSQGCHC